MLCGAQVYTTSAEREREKGVGEERGRAREKGRKRERETERLQIYRRYRKLRSLI